ncbi:hypothetical protein [Streptomyces sp. NBC_00690]|uniref:hypothetical protein n=1 Tax=Streptomyces sp. NBC_00690 TaxID=2975808 RepID=UPI002E27DB10|nr:hypothetical protein [Streptomyces sp. NBC_00690]
MLITTTALMGMPYKLDLTPTATKALSVMVDRSESGGEVHMNQAEIDDILQVGPSSMSRAMGLLVQRGLVLRSGKGRGHSYALNPAIAGYTSADELTAEMSHQLAQGGPPPILIPKYQVEPPKPGTGGLHAVA